MSSSIDSTNRQEPPGNKDKPKQQRPGRACDTCRRRKVRCEGAAPCNLCVAQSIPCTYEQRATKRGPPKGYVESLERRLEAMESLLAQFADKEGRSSGVNDSAASTQSHEGARNRTSEDADDGTPFPATTPGSSSSNGPPATGLDAIDELSSKLNDLAVEQNRYIGRGSGLHLVRSMEQYAEPFSPSVLSTEHESTIETLWREEHKMITKAHVAPLPSEQLANRLVDAAFNDFSVRWVIPRAYFDECVRKGMIDSDPSFKGLYFAILALGSRAVPNTMDSARTASEARIVEGWTWFKAALSASESHLESPTLFTLLRTTVLVMWQLGAAGYVGAWSTIGWGVRQAIDAGAHCEDRSDWSYSPVRNQLRKRAFHTLVAFDYYISSTLGRPFAIQEDDWDVTPPLSIADEDLLEWDRQTSLARLSGQPLPPQPPTSSESTVPGSPVVPVHVGGYPWSAVVALHSIIARAMKSLYGMRRDKTLKGTRDAVRHLDSSLNAWLEKVPAHVRWNPGQQDDEALLSSAALYAGYYSTQILIHREYISPTRSAALGFPSLAICSNAARSCAHVLDTLRQRRLLHRAYSYAPVTAVQNAWILLLGRFASPDSNAQLTPSAAADVKRCINVLHDLAPTTYLALRCYEGMVRLASLVTSPPSTRNPLSQSQSSQKRSMPADWTDGQSPAASQSDRPSPSSSGDAYGPTGGANGGDSSNHKQRKLHQPQTTPSRTMPLPLSTSDLSSETFKGRPTFAADESSKHSSNSTAMNGYHGNNLPPTTTAGLDGSSMATAAYPDLYPPTTLAPSQYTSPTLGDLSNLGSLPNPPYLPPPSALPSDLAPPNFAAFDPNLATPLASQHQTSASGAQGGGTNGTDFDSFDLGTDFFSLNSSSAANGGRVISEPHVPADVGRAASDLWQTFSAMPPLHFGDSSNLGGGGARTSWNPATFAGNDVFGGVPGVAQGDGGGLEADGTTYSSASFDPFSQWNFSTSPRNDASSTQQNGDWDYYTR
ncbi:Zn(II)2Cys6 transcription factor [Sporobolomyces salmoneus]|uniref:Zn(II)2Cys6 transcription factor n=1 Tax=Sporobolomyces salmoneus TaxID=183962 RepID=UPI003175128A